jgi:hypothetical protein
MIQPLRHVVESSSARTDVFRFRWVEFGIVDEALSHAAIANTTPRPATTMSRRESVANISSSDSRVANIYRSS